MGPQPHPLVDDARAALRALARAAPVAAIAADALAELDAAWAREPLTLGIDGEATDRTALLDLLAGGVLGRLARMPGAAALRVRRGDETRFHARRDDDSVEEAPFPPDDPGRATRHARLAQAEQVLQTLERPPARWWQLGRRLARWVRRLRTRHQRRLAIAELAEARRALEAPGDGPQHRFLRRLRELASTASGVRELTLVVDGGPLPAGVEAFELNGWSRAAARVDLVIVAGGPDLVAGTLAAQLVEARALQLGNRVREQVAAAIVVLDEQIAAVEAGFTARIDRLEATRIPDPDAHVQAELARLRPAILASVSSVMEHASVHLGSELALLGNGWRGAIEAATSRDELQAAASTIDEQSTAEVQRIAGEVRTLAMGGLGGCAHDIVPGNRAPVPSVELLPSLANARRSAVGDSGWLAGIFRTLDSRRADALEKVDQRIARLGQVAAAELLDAEPRLHAALGAAVASAIAATVARRTAALDSAVAAEREAIAVERELLAPLVEVRQRASGDAARLAHRCAGPS